MDKYMIIDLAHKSEVLSDLHDIEIKMFESQSKNATATAKRKGITLLFRETFNDRIEGDSFALIEYNFDLTKEEKEKIVKFVSQFFNDGEIYEGMEIKSYNTLKAVRFLKTDGELFLVENK